jgi:hypothetical protein
VRYFLSRDHVVGDEVKVVAPVKAKRRIKRVHVEPEVVAELPPMPRLPA